MNEEINKNYLLDLQKQRDKIDLSLNKLGIETKTNETEHFNSLLLKTNTFLKDYEQNFAPAIKISQVQKNLTLSQVSSTKHFVSCTIQNKNLIKKELIHDLSGARPNSNFIIGARYPYSTIPILFKKGISYTASCKENVSAIIFGEKNLGQLSSKLNTNNFTYTPEDNFQGYIQFYCNSPLTVDKNYFQLEESPVLTDFSSYDQDYSKNGIYIYGKNLISPDNVRYSTGLTQILPISQLYNEKLFPPGEYLLRVFDLKESTSVDFYSADGTEHICAGDISPQKNTLTFSSNKWINRINLRANLQNCRFYLSLFLEDAYYEPFKIAKFIPFNKLGNLSTIESISPNMTIFSDNNDLNLIGHYNMDIEDYIRTLLK